MIIIHGDNEIASRNLFLAHKDQAVKSGKQLVILSGSSLTLPQIVTSSQSQSLFGSTNIVFVEGFFTRRPSNDKKTLTEYLLTHSTADVVLWESQDVTPALKSFPPEVIKKFDLPKHIFHFIDNWTISAFTAALTGAAPEQILALLAKRLHDLILVKEHAGVFPPWQISKLQNQASRYSLNDLQTMNHELLLIDYAQKTSSSPVDLAAALQFWLASIV